MGRFPHVYPYVFMKTLQGSRHRLSSERILRHSCCWSVGLPHKTTSSFQEIKRCFGSNPFKYGVDTLIIGGGPIGASTAYHLAKQRQDLADGSANSSQPSILVIEQDPSYKSCSAVYSAGGIRLQFSLRENVLMSLYGIDFLRKCDNLLATAPSQTNSMDKRHQALDIQYVEHGYLILASTELGARQLQENFANFQNIGCDDMIQLLKPDELKSRFPWVNTEDVVLGSFGCSGEGWFDPWSFVRAMHAKNKDLGVGFLSGTVTGATRNPDDSGEIMSVQVRTQSNEMHNIAVKTVVNAAGARAGQVLNFLAGGKESPLAHPLPVHPKKRCIYFFQCDSKHQPEGTIVPSMAPLTIDSSGSYFRSEGTHSGTGRFLCGISPPSCEDLDCLDPRQLENADPILFERDIWPAIANRVPAFNSLKVISSWAGLYDVNIVDHNCILDFHPELKNVLLVNGFSGHGLQHSPAAGRAAAELIDNNNQFTTLDLNIFRFDRLKEGGIPVLEMGIY
ncbi:FAD dependent oxidoreductase [Nitzschia inconspicua]|uniref:FAD-dependent oxidoreductase domain-containing protein 1 n=1 Tax=Nitzschia inconspicua TaxID=303405 RepID=A0A9K3LUR5_9STRA|nr:FAD dependent oxidoreductase [Nitzschia inconspicua]